MMKAALVSLSIVVLSLSSSASADLRQLMFAVSNGGSSPYNNRIYRIPLEGEREGELIEFAGPSNGLAFPYGMALDRGSGRLYVGNNDTGDIIEFEINADGTRGPTRVFGNFGTYFSSMAVQPLTGRVYIGVQGGTKENRGLYRMATDGSGYEKIFEESVDQAYFYDDCWIDFDPSNNGIIYVTTGFDNQVRMFSVGGVDLGTLGSYGDMAIPTVQLSQPHDEGYWLSHQCFIPAGGGDYHLLVNVHYVPENQQAHQQKRLLLFDPDLDSFIGELPLSGPSLILPGRILGMVQDEVTGILYGGVYGYADVFEIAADYSGYEIIFNPPGMPDVTHTRVAVSYGHSDGADTDGDGLTDDDETDTYGTDPLDADSDTDGYTDYEEINHDDVDGGYNPFPAGSDTDAHNADSDSDGFSDLVEINGGSDPLVAGWTAAQMNITISFQPRNAACPSGYAPDAALPYTALPDTASRGYGW